MLDDGTVRLRWRVKYLTWIQIFNPKNFNKEIRKRNVSNTYYLLTFHYSV